uniref:B box-type domain-containing protein n=1 Tax=Amphimedon queenslandica TaxID=400682 RepID=A0A1X7U4H7_AMPQE
AFHLNNLKELYSAMKKMPAVSDPQEATCSDHGRPLELFCESCDTLICISCSVHSHKHHEYDLVTEIYSKQCQKLRECLSPVEAKKEVLKNFLSALAEKEGEIRERGEGVLEEIHKMVEKMMDVLRQSERKLTEQAKRVIDDKLKVLSEQVKSAEASLHLLEDVGDYVEQSLKTGSPQQVLGSKKQMMKHMSEVTAGINVEGLHPKEKADFILSKSIKSLHHIGDIISGSVALQQCRVKKIDHITPTDTTRSLSISIKAPNSSLFEGSTTGQFQYPCDIAIDRQGLVYVADFFNNRIQKFSPCGKFITEFGDKGAGSGSLNEPNGITIDTAVSGLVYVSERSNHCISVFNNEGVFISSFGREGSNVNEFYEPLGLTFDKNGFLY